MKIFCTVISVLFFLQITEGFSQDLDSVLIVDKSTKVTQSWDRLSISAGALFAGYSGNVTIGSQKLGLGLSVDVERLLGLSVSTWGIVGSTKFRLGKKRRGQLSLDYFGVNRSSTKVLIDDLVIGDEIIPVHSEINTRFNWKIITLKYDYSFYQDDRVSLGISAGLYILPVSFSIEVVNYKGTSQDILAPLPILGLRTDVAITRRVYFHQTVGLLFLQANGFTGSILDFDFSMEYRPLNHLGIGLGVNSTQWKILSDGNSYPGIDFYGEMETGFTGVYINSVFYM